MAFEKKPLNYDELEEIVEYSIGLENRIEDEFDNVDSSLASHKVDGSHDKLQIGAAGHKNFEMFKRTNAGGAISFTVSTSVALSGGYSGLVMCELVLVKNGSTGAAAKTAIYHITAAGISTFNTTQIKKVYGDDFSISIDNISSSGFRINIAGESLYYLQAMARFNSIVAFNISVT